MYEALYGKPVHWASFSEIISGKSLAIRKGSFRDQLVREAYFHERMTGISQPVHESYDGKPVFWSAWK